jgi:hypothetical protein
MYIQMFHMILRIYEDEFTKSSKSFFCARKTSSKEWNFILLMNLSLHNINWYISYLCVGTYKYCVPVKEKTYVVGSLAFQITVNIHFLIIPSPIINLKSRRKFVTKYILSPAMYQTDGTKQGVESKKLKVAQLVKKFPTLPTIYISLLQWTLSHESVMTSVYDVIYQCGSFHII